MAKNNVPEVEDIRCKKTCSGQTAEDAFIWNVACKLLPAERLEYEKERLKNIIGLYRDGFYADSAKFEENHV